MDQGLCDNSHASASTTTPIPEHTEHVVRPGALLNCPAGHVVHAPALLLLVKVPAAQSAHTVAPPGENCPGRQPTQLDWPVTLV